jgi:hypothetical protein
MAKIVLSVLHSHGKYDSQGYRYGTHVPFLEASMVIDGVSNQEALQLKSVEDPDELYDRVRKLPGWSAKKIQPEYVADDEIEFLQIETIELD